MSHKFALLTVLYQVPTDWLKAQLGLTKPGR